MGVATAHCPVLPLSLALSCTSSRSFRLAPFLLPILLFSLSLCLLLFRFFLYLSFFLSHSRSTLFSRGVAPSRAFFPFLFLPIFVRLRSLSSALSLPFANSSVRSFLSPSREKSIGRSLARGYSRVHRSSLFTRLSL